MCSSAPIPLTLRDVPCYRADILTSVPIHLRYDVALLYLKQTEWDLESAIEAYTDDEQWEKDHPLEAKQKIKKGKNVKDTGMRRFVGGAR